MQLTKKVTNKDKEFFKKQTISKCGKQLMKNLITKLEKVPARRFDMSVWSCGTKACAAGWACTLPSFKKKGLRMTPGPTGNVKIVDGNNQYYGTVAMETVLGCSTDLAKTLFLPYVMLRPDHSPKEVAAFYRAVLPLVKVVD